MIIPEIIEINYPQPEGTVYLNTSSSGLVSKSSIEEAYNFNKHLAETGSSFVEDFYVNQIPDIRRSVCEFVGASQDELALIPNFSHGLNAVIPSLSKLSRVLLYRDDYPSLTLPFELHDFDIFWLESNDGFHIDLNQIEDAIVKNKIEILAISHVQYLNGFEIDVEGLASLCKKHQVLLLLDATQSLGSFSYHFNKSGVNILITSNYKWMNSGYGTGILCMDKETLSKFPPKIGGFNSYKYVDGTWNFSKGILSYEPGHLNMAGLAMLKNAIDFKLRLGVEEIERYNYGLLRYFVEHLGTNQIELIGGKTTTGRKNIIGFKGDQKLEKYLTSNGIMVKRRRNIIRIAFHFYNTKKDVITLLDALESYFSEN